MPNRVKKHVRAMTYEPKIPAVRSGECRQTIRKGNKVSEGDEILWHGWTGLPYRSKWNWRKRVVVTEAIPIIVDKRVGIGYEDALQRFDEWRWCGWDSDYVNNLATKDFISPPTGDELRKVLSGLNNTELHFEHYQIIRW